MSAVEAIGCKLVLRVQRVEDYDPTIKSAKAVGIVIPEHEDNKRAQAGIDKGVVLEIGPTCNEEYIKGVKVGDTVGFAKYGGKIVSALDDNEDRYLIINDEDVVCKFRSKNG